MKGVNFLGTDNHCGRKRSCIESVPPLLGGGWRTGRKALCGGEADLPSVPKVGVRLGAEPSDLGCQWSLW